MTIVFAFLMTSAVAGIWPFSWSTEPTEPTNIRCNFKIGKNMPFPFFNEVEEVEETVKADVCITLLDKLDKTIVSVSLKSNENDIYELVTDYFRDKYTVMDEYDDRVCFKVGEKFVYIFKDENRRNKVWVHVLITGRERKPVKLFQSEYTAVTSVLDLCDSINTKNELIILPRGNGGLELPKEIKN